MRPRAVRATTAGGGLLVLAGLAVVGLNLWLVGNSLGRPVVAVFGAGVPAFLGLGLVVAGRWLSRTSYPAPQVGRVLGWWLLGTFTGVVFGGATFYFLLQEGIPWSGAVPVLMNAMALGAIAGVLLGYFDVMSRRRAAAFAEEHDKLIILNRILRHDVRNDLNVVIGMLDLLEDQVDGDGTEFVERADRAATDAVELTDEARRFVDVVGDEDRDLEPTSVADVLTDQAAYLRDTFPEALSLVEGPLTDVEVLADEMFPTVVRNIMTNAVQHNRSEEPVVRVSTDVGRNSVVIGVADNGPGVPDEMKESIFGRGNHDEDTGGTGIGLYLANVLVDAYDGEIWVEDCDPTGAKFCIELQVAN